MLNGKTRMDDRQHYARGTAAGSKGNSAQARENSRDAAKAVTESLGNRHREMIAAWTPYGAGGAIPEQIANDTDLPVHVVRPRAGELVKRKLLFEVGKRPGGMGKSVMAYSVTAPPEGEAA